MKRENLPQEEQSLIRAAQNPNLDKRTRKRAKSRLREHYGWGQAKLNKMTPNAHALTSGYIEYSRENYNGNK